MAPMAHASPMALGMQVRGVEENAVYESPEISWEVAEQILRIGSCDC